MGTMYIPYSGVVHHVYHQPYGYMDPRLSGLGRCGPRGFVVEGFWAFVYIWDFPKIRGTLFWGPLFSETPISG